MRAVAEFFGSTHQAARCLAQELVEKTGEAVQKAIKLKNLRTRAGWQGWKIIECEPDAYALIRWDNEMERYPDRGTVDVAIVEQFICARERERCW